MRYARFAISKRRLPAALPLCAALVLGCHGSVGDASGGGNNSGNPGLGGNSGGGTTGTGTAGTTGTNTPDPPCTGATDPRLVPAPQRILRLPTAQMLTTVRSLPDSTEATMLQGASILPNTLDQKRKFPPLTGESSSIDSATWTSLDGAA